MSMISVHCYNTHVYVVFDLSVFLSYNKLRHLCFSVTFYIDGDELKVKDSGPLDYENQAKVVILVRTTDNGVPPLWIEVWTTFF